MFYKHNLDYLYNKASINNGYLRVYYPKHPNAYSNGCVFYHRLVVENKLIRYLDSEEFIHHINEDRLDNSEDNLEVTSSSEHVSMHNRTLLPIMCSFCGNTFLPKSRRRIYCSLQCSKKDSNKIKWPNPEELEKLVWEKPTEHVGKDLGVSGRAIGKKCKKYGIKKPPRGYWMKLQAEDYKILDKNGIIWPTKEELRKLVWEKPLKIIAKDLGVSSKTVSSRCTKFDISLPLNSYWRRKENRNYNGR